VPLASLVGLAGMIIRVSLSEVAELMRNSSGWVDVVQTSGSFPFFPAALLLVFVWSCWPSTAGAASLWRTAYFYQPAADSLPIASIPWSMYTHVIQYAALPTDGCALDTGRYLITPASITAFTSAAHANGVKALIGLMQDNDASLMAKCTDAAHVAGFAANLASFINANGYDGFDLDWENGIIPLQYAQLIDRLRALLPLKVVTVATDVTTRSMLATIQGAIDQINIMNYDSDTGFFTGTIPTTTWFNSAILAAGETARISAEGSINYMLSAGIAAGKIGLGQPFYARVTQGCRAGYQSGTSCGQGVTGPDQPFAFGNAATNSRAAMNYNTLLSSLYWSGGKHLWDDDRKSAYLSYISSNATCSPPPCNTDAYVSYPDARQLQSAIALINSKGLGGIMVFSLEGEYLPDASGDARYPLSSAIMATNTPKSPTSTTDTPKPPTWITVH